MSDGESMFVIVDSPSSRSGPIKGRMVKTRRTLLPDIEEMGSLRPLDIPDSCGLAEVTHFVYFPEQQIVGVEFNYYGPRVSSLGEYIRAKYGRIDRVEMEPILNRDVTDTLERIGEVHLIELKVGRNGLWVLEELDRNLRAAFHAAASVSSGAEIVEIVLRKKRYGRVGFALPWPKEKILRWVSDGGLAVRENVSRFRVRAVDKGTGEVRTFDLLEDKFVMSRQVVRHNERRRMIDSDSMFEAIMDAHSDLRDQLGVGLTGVRGENGGELEGVVIDVEEDEGCL